MKKWKQTKPGTISKFFLQLHMVSTGKCKDKLWEHKDTQMLLWLNLKMT
jgi:hypothetical protein